MSASHNNNGERSPPARDEPKQEDDQAASATSTVNAGTGHQNNAASNTNGIADEPDMHVTQADIDALEGVTFNETDGVEFQRIRPDSGNRAN